MKTFQFARNIYPYALALVAFSIPISYRFSLYALGLLYLVSIIGFLSQPFSFKILKNRLLVLFAALYLLHLFSLSFSDNLEYGINDMAQKLSLILIPLAFIPFRINREELELSEKAFLYALIGNSIYLFARAAYQSTLITPQGIFFRPFPVGVPWENFFFYELFVQPHHPTYYSMYLALGISLLGVRIKQQTKINIKILYYLGILFLSTVTFFASSRAGILTVFVILLVILFLNIKRRGKVIVGIALSVFLTIGTILVLRNERVKFIINSVTSRDREELTDFDRKLILEDLVRFKIWGSVPMALKSYEWIFGVGAGDVKDELLRVYEKEKIEFALNEKLNAHNQYLQTFISTGIFGFIILLAILIYIVKIGVNNGSMVLFLFAMIIAINFLFESILERVFGVIFFAFFSFLLTLNHLKKPV